MLHQAGTIAFYTLLEALHNRLRIGGRRIALKTLAAIAMESRLLYLIINNPP